MSEKKINLNTINQISEDFILNMESFKENSIIKITTESYYELYEKGDEEIERICKEWFETFSGNSHAYRDGSKLPFVNLVEVKKIRICQKKE